MHAARGRRIEPNDFIGTDSGNAWVLKQALAKFRVEVDWFGNPERVHREVLGMRWLVQLARPGIIPELLLEDRDHYVIAGPVPWNKGPRATRQTK